MLQNFKVASGFIEASVIFLVTFHSAGSFSTTRGGNSAWKAIIFQKLGMKYACIPQGRSVQKSCILTIHSVSFTIFY